MFHTWFVITIIDGREEKAAREGVEEVDVRSGRSKRRIKNVRENIEGWARSKSDGLFHLLLPEGEWLVGYVEGQSGSQCSQHHDEKVQLRAQDCES